MFDSVGRYLESASYLLPGNIFHLVLLVTARCNHRCGYCYYWQGQGRKDARPEMTLKEYEQLAEQVGRVMCLSVSGGEPTLRTDLADIISVFHKKAKVRMVQLHSNGSFPERLERTVRTLLERHSDLAIDVCLSIDGLGADHDDVQQSPGSFEQLLATVHRLEAPQAKTSGLGIELNTTYSALTAPRVKDIAKFVTETLQKSFNMALVRGNPRDPSALGVDPNEFRKVAREIGCYEQGSSADSYPFSSFVDAIRKLVPDLSVDAVLQGRQQVPCRAGRQLLVVDEVGDVFPCEMLGQSFGNLRESEYNLNALISGPKAEAIKAFIEAGRCHCSWECAIPVSLLFSPAGLVKVGKTWSELAIGRVMDKAAKLTGGGA